MGNVWHKPRYVRDDYDPATGELRAEVIHPGLYFEDDEALRSFRRSARIRNRKIEPSILGAPARYDGVALRVATPEQVVRFKLTARTMEGSGSQRRDDGEAGPYGQRPRDSCRPGPPVRPDPANRF